MNYMPGLTKEEEIRYTILKNEVHSGSDIETINLTERQLMSKGFDIASNFLYSLIKSRNEEIMKLKELEKK